MKTKTNKQIKRSTINNQQSTNSGLKNRTMQSRTAPETAALETATPNTLSADGQTGSAGEGKGEVVSSIRPYVNFAEREANRQLPVERVLAILKRWNPRQYGKSDPDPFAHYFGEFANHRTNASVPIFRSFAFHTFKNEALPSTRQDFAALDPLPYWLCNRRQALAARKPY
jgi:hypothetical protein